MTNRHGSHEPTQVFDDAKIDELIGKHTGESGKSSTQNHQRKAQK